jgi:hypothetical protein
VGYALERAPAQTKSSFQIYFPRYALSPVRTVQLFAIDISRQTKQDAYELGETICVAALEVKLDAYIVPDDHKVYKCFPGKAYRFYELIRDENAIFLDILGLDTLDSDSARWTRQQITDTIRSDRQQRETEMIARGRTPPRRTGYSKTGYSRTDRRDTTFAIGLYQTAKQGDLIVVPAEGYQRDVLIGELLDAPGKLVEVTAKDSDGNTLKYMGRRVRWLGRQPKRLFPEELIQLLHSQTAFFDIGRRFYETMYEIAYENFTFGDVFVASFKTSKQHFTSRDNLIVSVWFEALSAIRDAVESGDTDFLKNSSFFEIAVAAQASTESELSININSPGEFILRSTKEFALVAMTIFAMAVAQPTAADAQNVHVNAKVVGSASTECLGKIDESVKRYIEALGAKGWREACKTAVEARDSATLKTEAHLKSPTATSN